MRITSQSFIDRATAQTRSPKVKLSSFNGNTLVQDDIDLISVNYEDPHDTFIGSLSSRYIEVEVGEEAFNVDSLNAEKFKLWIRFVGSPTEMLVGEFRIDFESSVFDEVKRIYSLIMFDDAFFLDQQVIEFAYSSLTMGQVVEEVCSIVGVSLDIDSLNALPFASKSAELWNISFEESISYREIINDFSKVNLALPYFNSLGFLSFATPFTNAAVAEVSGFDYTSLNFDKKAKPINAVVFEVEEGVDDPIFKRNEASIALHGLNELKIVGSRFMSLWTRSEVQSVVNQWYNIIHARNPEGFFYYPFNTDQVMRPDLEAADNVKIIDRDGTEYPSILSSVSWTWVNGGLKGRLECPQLPETLTDYVLGGLDRDMLEMGVKVNRLKKEITIGISDVKKQIKEIETTPGPSAYEIALENGFTGTEQEWLDSLQGMDGENGIPGKDGVDGKPTYTWVKYADTPTTGMSNSATDKKYIGLAFNKSTPTMSTNYNDYQWSLMPQNIEIGGRNLFARSNIEDLALSSTVLSSPSYKGLSFPVEEGKKYSIYRTDNTNNRFRLAWTADKPEARTELISLINYDSQAPMTLNTVTAPSGANWGFIYLSNADTSGDTIPNVMITKGDVFLDWTPAPEDVQNEILRVEIETTAKIDVTTELIQLEKSTRETELYGTGEVDEDGNPIGGLIASVRESAGRITILDDKITDEVNSREELDDRFSEYKAQTELGETYWQVDIANKLTGKVDQEVIDLFNIFFRVDLQKGAIIGRQGQPVQIVIDNDRILFQENEVTFAYWEGGTMHVDHIIATITATIGYHQISKYDSPYGKTSLIQIEQEAI